MKRRTRSQVCVTDWGNASIIRLIGEMLQSFVYLIHPYLLCVSFPFKCAGIGCLFVKVLNVN